MASISVRPLLRGVFALIFLFISIKGVFSQENPVLLAAEIQSVQRKLSDSRLPPEERKGELVKMARLFELSGNTEGAAGAWSEAARAVPGNLDHNALLRSALCIAAMGEFEKAGAELAPVMGSSNRSLLTRARFLHAQIESLRTGRTDALKSLLTLPDFAEYKPGIYYSIWKITGDAAERRRLMEEFPQSPEARIAGENDSAAPLVGAAPTALWLLMGIQPAPSAAGAPAVSGAPPRTSPASPAANPPPEDPPAPSASSGPAMLQTGLFGREENARALAERLRSAGFSPLVTKKTVNGQEHWAVGVLPGADPSRTILLLKDKGFESFPVY
jgi:hypothetical protein